MKKLFDKLSIYSELFQVGGGHRNFLIVFKSLIRYIILYIILFLMAVSTASAKIVIKGTDAEKKQVKDAIKEIKKESNTAKEGFDKLEKLSEEIVISVGEKIDSHPSDIAVRLGDKIVINKSAIHKMKQIGEGEALDQSSLKYILVHEALGHLLNEKEGKKHGEKEAMATTNKVREENKSSKRTKYVEIDKKGRPTVPFDDGSKVDLTDALKCGKRDKIAQSGTINFVLQDLLFPGSTVFSLDLSDPGNIHLDIPLSLGGGSFDLTPIDFDMKVQFESTSTQDLYDMIVTDFYLELPSFDILGTNSGINTLSMWYPERTPFGTFDYSNNGLFEFSGDLLMYNDLYQGENAIIAMEQWSGKINTLTGKGSAEVKGSKFATVPEPATILLLGFGLIGLIGIKKKN